MKPRNELDVKLTLESNLRSHLSALDLEMVAEFARNITTPNFQFRAFDALAALLLSHSMKTAEKFKQVISNSLPLTMRMTPSESAEIDFILTTHYQTWSPKQAEIILDTTQRHASVVRGRAARIESDPAKVSEVATGLFSRSLAGRRRRIAQFQTLAAAEIAKHTEAQVLIGMKKALSPSKTWRHQGDALVRDAHVRAGGQEIPVGSPFTVMGQELMFPGDTSLGATIGNTINCRCFVVYDIEGARREL